MKQTPFVKMHGLGNDFIIFSNVTKLGKDEVLKKIEIIC